MADNNINDPASENSSYRNTYTPLLIVGSVFGGLTLLFFMVLVILSAMNRSVPPDDRYLVIIILGFGSALSASFVGGSAAAKGDIPITVARHRPFSFSVGGGIAVLIIVLVLGWALYLPKNNGPNPQIDTIIKLKETYDSNPYFMRIFSNIETCKPLYKSWGGPFTYQQMNSYLGFLDHIGFLYKQRKIDKNSIDETLGNVIVATYSYHEIRKYIDGIRTNAKQPLACNNFYQLAEELCKGKEEFISMIRKCQ